MKKPYELAFDPNRQTICIKCDKSLDKELRNIDQCSFNGSYYEVPASKINFLVIESVDTPVSISKNYIAARNNYIYNTEAEIKAISTMIEENHLHVDDFAFHQKQFILKFINRDGIINGSEQGTGKTRSVWALLSLWDVKRAVIVCPVGIIPEWEREYKKVFRDYERFDVHLLQEGGSKLKAQKVKRLYGSSASVIVVNYEVIGKMIGELLQYNPDVIIFDESWRIKSRTAKVTKAAIKLADNCPKTILLSGTVFANHVGDIWSQSKTVDEYLFHEKYDDFMAEYAKYKHISLGDGRGWNKVIGCNNPVKLIRTIEPVWFRATKELCLDLPNKLPPVRIKLDFPPHVKKLYKEIQDKGLEALGDDFNLAGEAVLQVRLSQICSGYLPIVNSEKSTVQETVYDFVPYQCAKLRWLREFVKERFVGDSSRKMIVWCKFSKTPQEVQRIVDELSEIMPKGAVAAVTGKTKNLEEIKESFNTKSEGEIQIIVAQIKKLAYGHNLQSCDINVYYSHTYSYIERAQSEDRSHRMGRVGAVQYYELEYKSSIDGQALEAFYSKKDLSLRLSPTTISKK